LAERLRGACCRDAASCEWAGCHFLLSDIFPDHLQKLKTDVCSKRRQYPGPRSSAKIRSNESNEARMARSDSEGLLSGLTRNVVFLALASLFADIATEMLYPVLPIYLTQTLGAGGRAVGLVEGVAAKARRISSRGSPARCLTACNGVRALP
jgi:hypothetical protein